MGKRSPVTLLLPLALACTPAPVEPPEVASEPAGYRVVLVTIDGVRRGLGGVTLGQIAATVAALLGEDYRAAPPAAAPPLPGSVSEGPAP